MRPSNSWSTMFAVEKRHRLIVVGLVAFGTGAGLLVMWRTLPWLSSGSWLWIERASWIAGVLGLIVGLAAMVVAGRQGRQMEQAMGRPLAMVPPGGDGNP